MKALKTTPREIYMVFSHGKEFSSRKRFSPHLEGDQSLQVKEKHYI